MTSYTRKFQLWTAVVEAGRNCHNLQELRFQIECLGSRVDDWEGMEVDPPLLPELRSLLTRAKRLNEDFAQHDQEIDDLFQQAAWAYAAMEWDIRCGDRIECLNWKDVKQVASADALSLRGSDIGELSLRGRVVKKDGEPGKEKTGFNCFTKNGRT